MDLAPYSTLDRLRDALGEVRARAFGDPPAPTLMHVSHSKAGSTWVSNLLHQLFRSRCAPRGHLVAGGTSLSEYYFAPGRVYRAMFIPRDQFMAHPELHGIKRFVILRDLRDNLVSAYFSVRNSHDTTTPVPGMEALLTRRQVLQSLPREDGLLFLMDSMERQAALQRSWLNQGELVRHYEEMMRNPLGFFQELFLDRLQLPIAPGTLARAVRRTHFQTVYGRKPGKVDEASHGRQGLPGDWRNHFTPAVRQEFGRRFGELLVASGHETDQRWITEQP